MTMTDALPVQLSDFLDAGCDLTVVPDLDLYAKLIMRRHLIPTEDRQAMIDFYLHNYVTWEAGETVTVEGLDLEPSLVRMRHALWLAEALHDDDLAERFVAALPDALREASR